MMAYLCYAMVSKMLLILLTFVNQGSSTYFFGLLRQKIPAITVNNPSRGEGCDSDIIHFPDTSPADIAAAAAAAVMMVA